MFRQGGGGSPWTPSPPPPPPLKQVPAPSPRWQHVHSLVRTTPKLPSLRGMPLSILLPMPTVFAPVHGLLHTLGCPHSAPCMCAYVSQALVHTLPSHPKKTCTSGILVTIMKGALK